MDVDAIRSLHAYNRWANERLLNLAETLPSRRTRDHIGSSFGSIHGTLAHILAGEVIWLERWRGGSPPKLMDGANFADLAAIRARWSVQQQEMDVFLAGLTPERLLDTVSYIGISGERWSYRLWQMMVHLVNHGTHHRSELADMLTRAGLEPPATDFLIYYDERASPVPRLERPELGS
jgi:uncharacterized damage-inducible protein DinB